MADTKTTALTELASGAIDDLDVAPVVDVSDTTQGASGTLKKFKWSSIKATLKTYLDTLYLSLTGGTITGGTRTTSGSTLTITETLNNAGVTFPGAVVVDVTDTASNASSLLADFKVGGVSKFNVTKAGFLYGGAVGYGNSYAGNNFYLDIVQAAGVETKTRIGTGYVIVGSYFGIGNNGVINPDVYLYRDAANTLAQRNGTSAQTYRIYGTYTDASNYRRVQLSMTTAGVAELKPEGAGSGASGNVLHISGLPTSNPGPGILWNNAGSVAIGT